MSIYNRAVRDTGVDRRIVRAVDRVIRSLPVPGGVFGRVDVWNALQANAKEARVPMELDWNQVGKTLDSLCLACILTCRGGAYSEVVEVPPLKAEASAEPLAPAPVVVEASPRPSPTLRAVIDVLQAGPKSTRELCQTLGCSESAVRSRTFRLRTQGLICEVGTVNTENHHGRVMTIWGLPLGTREVPSPAPAPEVVPPAPVKAEPWTARPKEGPDEAGRWRWEARATLETRVSRGLGWLAEREVLPALQELERPLQADTDALQRRLAELEAEAHERRVADQRAGRTVEGKSGEFPPQAEEDPRLTLLAEIGDVLSLGPSCSPKSVLRQLQATDGRAGLLRRVREVELAERRVRALQAEVEELKQERPAAGPAWPSLRNLDVEQAEETINAIERRCAAWRTLLAAARELAP